MSFHPLRTAISLGKCPTTPLSDSRKTRGEDGALNNTRHYTGHRNKKKGGPIAGIDREGFIDTDRCGMAIDKLYSTRVPFLKQR